jgi:hypothetical protein
MAQNKKPAVKVQVVKNVRGLEFNCSKLLKKLRFSMSNDQFRTMILNEKSYQLKKKKSSGAKAEE